MFNSRRPVWVSVPHRREIVHEHFEHFLHIFLAFHTLRCVLCDCDFNTFLFYLYLFTPSSLVLLCVVSRSHVYAADDCSWAERCGKKKKCIRKWHKNESAKTKRERKERTRRRYGNFSYAHTVALLSCLLHLSYMRPERSPKWQAESR